jgi:hypothetical protein
MLGDAIIQQPKIALHGGPDTRIDYVPVVEKAELDT